MSQDVALIAGALLAGAESLSKPLPKKDLPNPAIVDATNEATFLKPDVTVPCLRLCLIDLR